MKQKKAAQNTSVQQKRRKKSRRREIAGLPRFLVILLTIVLLVASLVATYARFRPVILTLPTQIYQYNREVDISYHVQNKPTELFDQTLQGMNSVYLRSNAVSILPVIKYELRGNNFITISGSYQMLGVLRQLDQKDPNKLISSQTITLSELVEINTVDSGVNLEQSAQVDLAAINDLVNELESKADSKYSYELEIGLQSNFTLSSTGRVFEQIQERPGMIIQLNNDTFTVRVLDLEDRKDSIWRFRDWRLELSPMPIWLYPTAILISLLLLLFFLTTTRSRKLQRYNRQLQKMLRMARGRLMMIGDKAWEPEWCITASNYKTMVKTAKKLKHPIFCYIDHESDVPTALFYVYYGENNYCFTYTGGPDRKWNKQNIHSNHVAAKASYTAEPMIKLPVANNKLKNENLSESVSAADQTINT